MVRLALPVFDIIFDILGLLGKGFAKHPFLSDVMYRLILLKLA